MSKSADQKWRATEEATERLEEILAADPDLCEAAVHECLRVVPGKRAIFDGEFAGQRVVYRLLMHENGPEQSAKEWHELIRVNAYMNEGALRSVLPIAQVTGKGLIVMEREQGRPLLEYLRSLQSRALRMALIRQAGAWIAAYCAPSQGPMDPNPDRWLNRAAKARAAQEFDELRLLEDAIFAQMQRLAPRLSAPWRRAISHGDFHLNNLFHHDGVLTGFDLGGSGRLPIYKDRARALTHMARRGMLPSRRKVLGMDAGAYEAFSEGLTPEEADLVLPFFIAFETLVRAETRQLPPRRIRLAEKMQSALLDDLKQV